MSKVHFISRTNRKAACGTPYTDAVSIRGTTNQEETTCAACSRVLPRDDFDSPEDALANLLTVLNEG
jgi:hypothetical protein